MEHRALTALILRIAGLLIIVTSIVSAAKNFAGMFHPDVASQVGTGPLLMTFAVSVALPVLMGVYLVYFPRTVASGVLKIDGAAVDSGQDAVALQRVGFAVMGLWLAVYAVLDALYVYARSRIYPRIFTDFLPGTQLPPLSPDDFGILAAGVFQFLIGIWLVLGNRALVNLLMRARG